MNDTIARDPRKDILALMKLLADEKHESEALADELAETKRDRHRWADRCHALESQMRGQTFQTPDEKDVRIGELEAALREIAEGLLPQDRAAGSDKMYMLCASRLCGIARDAIRYTPETATKFTGPAGYKSAECKHCGRMFMDHSQEDLSCPSIAETPAEPKCDHKDSFGNSASTGWMDDAGYGELACNKCGEKTWKRERQEKPKDSFANRGAETKGDACG